jgi:hypothetical protein
MGTAVMLVVGQGAATANMEWCMTDPPIQVVSPGGHNLTVNNSIYYSPAERHLLRQITEDARTVPNGKGGTLITVNVHLPRGMSQAAVTSAEKRYQVKSHGDGAGGTVITLYLDVPIQ